MKKKIGLFLLITGLLLAYIPRINANNSYSNFSTDSLRHLPPEKAVLALDYWLKSVHQDKNELLKISDIAEEQFYNYSSLSYNEELYLQVLNFILASYLLDTSEKIRYEYQKKSILKNRVGSIAANFSYLSTDKKIHALDELDTNYILLYFYDPDCEDCQSMKQKIINSSINNANIKKGVTIVAIYPYEDKDLWENYQKELPGNWINGFDENGEIRDEQRYEIRHMPTLYLLDRKKNILAKDASLHQIELILKASEH